VLHSISYKQEAIRTEHCVLICRYYRQFTTVSRFTIQKVYLHTNVAKMVNIAST